MLWLFFLTSTVWYAVIMIIMDTTYVAAILRTGSLRQMLCRTTQAPIILQALSGEYL
ncbi:hypothetical protein DPMN_187833 [Dreissena polymorpha]|uniref:Uncharacterized protein n=1 Tax=Dreissena polymorpha TaxID=45954 RepID=A0A9D4DSU0_DREPO|nr:hypothetical protein DPMN_187833 [Dreissena polymorpha]